MSRKSKAEEKKYEEDILESYESGEWKSVANLDDEIARYAAKNKLDLLAMGSIGYGRSRFTSMGSVARRIAERNPIALLLVREASP